MSVNLVKGQKISLQKEAGGALTKVTLGLGWDISPGAGNVDLDASCATYNAAKALQETIYFGTKRSKNGSIQHSGDNLTGAGDGDDEQIVVELDKVGPDVQAIVFTVTSFRGQTFNVVANAYVRVINAADNKELCRYNLSGGAATTALIMCRVYLHNGEWKIAAIGEPANGKTVKDLTTVIANFL